MPDRPAVPPSEESVYERKPPWIDADGGEWEFTQGELVWCPACAFGFSSDHVDDGTDSYSCPNCHYLESGAVQ